MSLSTTCLSASWCSAMHHCLGHRWLPLSDHQDIYSHFSQYNMLECKPVLGYAPQLLGKPLVALGQTSPAQPHCCDACHGMACWARNRSSPLRKRRGCPWYVGVGEGQRRPLHPYPRSQSCLPPGQHTSRTVGDSASATLCKQRWRWKSAAYD